MIFLKKYFKEIIGFIFRYSGMNYVIREILCRNKATIVFYHDPKPETFKNHLEFLSNHYNFISLIRLVNAIQNKDWSDIPPKSLVITIDDGHRCNYKLLAIIKKYNICPTIYLCSHIINTNRKFWWMTEFPDYRKLKKYDNKQRVKSLKDNINYEPEKEYSTRQALNLEELKEMSNFVDFQSHSKFHPVLITNNDEECKEEIKGSKEYLEKLLNKKIKHFSYPNGDYSEREIEYLRNFGYKSARTLDIGWNDVNSDLYRLKTMGIEDNASINILCAQINGLFGYLRYLRYGSFNGIRPSFI